MDTDHDGIGNNADPDDDNDGVLDAVDALPLDPSESVDTDHDGIGNNADPDDDGDGVADGADAFPLNPAESVDTDRRRDREQRRHRMMTTMVWPMVRMRSR